MPSYHVSSMGIQNYLIELIFSQLVIWTFYISQYIFFYHFIKFIARNMNEIHIFLIKFMSLDSHVRRYGLLKLRCQVKKMSSVQQNINTLLSKCQHFLS